MREDTQSLINVNSEILSAASTNGCGEREYSSEKSFTAQPSPLILLNRLENTKKRLHDPGLDKDLKAALLERIEEAESLIELGDLLAANSIISEVIHRLDTIEVTREVPKVVKYSDYVKHRKAIEERHNKLRRKNKRSPGINGNVCLIGFSEFLKYERLHNVQLKVADQKKMIDPENFGLLCKDYLAWVKEDIYLDTRNNIEPYDHYHMRASKRGNGVYADRIQCKLDDLADHFSDIEFFNPRNIYEVQKTNMISVTLTFDPKYNQYETWEMLSHRLNLFNAKLRRLFGCSVHIARGYESHETGYPHIHANIIADKGYFVVRYYRGEWRVLSYNGKKKIKGKLQAFSVSNKDIRSKWSYRKEHNGHLKLTPVACVSSRADSVDTDGEYKRDNYKLSLNHHVKYYLKDITKRPDDSKGVLQAAILWKLRKRSFSLGKDFIKCVSTLLELKGLHNSNIFLDNTRKTLEKTYKFNGILEFGDIPPPLQQFRDDVKAWKIEESSLMIIKIGGYSYKEKPMIWAEPKLFTKENIEWSKKDTERIEQNIMDIFIREDLAR